jgi:hypothetical protein
MLGQPADHLAEIGGPLLGHFLRLLPLGRVAEVPQIELPERDDLVLGLAGRGLPAVAQPGVDVPGCLLAVADAPPGASPASVISTSWPSLARW